MRPPVTNEQLSEQHRQIVNLINEYCEQIISNQLTLSDNQTVLDDKIEKILERLEKIEELVNRLQAVLPGV